MVTLQVGVPIDDLSNEPSSSTCPRPLELQRGAPSYYDFRIRLLPDNRLHIELPRMPFGHGIANESAGIVSEVLDVSMDRIDTSLSPAAIRPGTPRVPGAGSTMTVELLDPLRQVAGQLRTLLVHSAARELGVTSDAITTHDGHAIAPDGRSLSYSAVASGAGDDDIDADV